MCEWDGCGESLDEYWEVEGGRRVCEFHGGCEPSPIEGFGFGREGEVKTKTSRAQKRVTRFIDLAAGGVGLGLGGL